MQDTDERTFAAKTHRLNAADTGGCPAYTAVGDQRPIRDLLGFTVKHDNAHLQRLDISVSSVYTAYDKILAFNYGGETMSLSDESLAPTNGILVPESVAREAWFDAIEGFVDAGMDAEKYQIVQARNIAADLGWGRTRDADWEDSECETDTQVIVSQDVTVSPTPADD